MEVKIVDLISWGVTVVVTLSAVITWWHDRKRHSHDYMIVQGLIRSINEHQKYYSTMYAEISSGRIQPTKDVLLSILQSAFIAHGAMMQQVLGVIKSLGVKKDIPFDAQKFLNPDQPLIISQPTEKKP